MRFLSLRTLTLATIIVMIFMRLVWMQIRLEGQIKSFETQTTPAVHPFATLCLSEYELGSKTGKLDQPFVSQLCQVVGDVGLSFSDYLAVSMWMFTATTFLITLSVRILSGSWLLALFSALIVLSRGSLVSAALHGQTLTFVSFTLAGTLFTWVYALRSGRKRGLLASSLFLATTSIMVPVFCLSSLFLSSYFALIFLVRPFISAKFVARRASLGPNEINRDSQLSIILRRFLKTIQRVVLGPSRRMRDFDGPTSHFKKDTRSLLSVIETPYLYWLLDQHQWRFLISTLLGTFGLSFLGLTLIFFEDPAFTFLRLSFQPEVAMGSLFFSKIFDLHYLISLLFLPICLLLPQH